MSIAPQLRFAIATSMLAASNLAQAFYGEVVATGLSQSLFLTSPASDSRQFIVQKTGAIRVIDNGVLLADPFLDLSSNIDVSGERGLLGLAFDPGYATNGRLYVDYIDRKTLNTVVARITVRDPGANVAQAISMQSVLSFAQPAFNYHKAGWIGFRPGDASNLYIATGDGGGANDPSNNGQNPGTLLGKMLRIGVSGNKAGHTVPADNPFVTQAGALPELWATGLRNPFRNSFDRATGDFWIADVGQGAREEVDFEAAGDTGGHNYGWRLREGTIPTPSGGVGGNAPGLTDPVFEYKHLAEGGLGNSIIGGYVYRGPSLASADGRYFFGDYVSNRIYSFEMGSNGVPFDLRDDTSDFIGGSGLSGLSSFGEDGFGRLYAMGFNGVVVRLVPEPATFALSLLGLAMVIGAARPRARARLRS